jgi:hypothetical protein
MKVKELIEKLKSLPPELPVEIMPPAPGLPIMEPAEVRLLAKQTTTVNEDGSIDIDPDSKDVTRFAAIITDDLWRES